MDKRRRLSGIAQAVAVDEVGGQALQRRPLKDVHSGIEELFELLDGALRRLERAEVARDAAAHRLSGLPRRLLKKVSTFLMHVFNI